MAPAPRPARRCADCRLEFSSSSLYMSNGGGIICRNRKACYERFLDRKRSGAKSKTGSSDGVRRDAASVARKAAAGGPSTLPHRGR